MLVCVDEGSSAGSHCDDNRRILEPFQGFLGIFEDFHINASVCVFANETPHVGSAEGRIWHNDGPVFPSGSNRSIAPDFHGPFAIVRM